MVSQLLFVGILVSMFLVAAIRYWAHFWLHDSAVFKVRNLVYSEVVPSRMLLATSREEIGRRVLSSFPELRLDPDKTTVDFGPQTTVMYNAAMYTKPVHTTSESVLDHPDLIVENLSEIERRIIADAMKRKPNQ
jgi:hypothetical protein